MGTWLSCAKNEKNKKGKTLFHTHDIIGTTNVPLDLHRGVSSRILGELDVSWNDNRSKGYCVYLHTIHPPRWIMAASYARYGLQLFRTSVHLIILLDRHSARIESLGRNVRSIAGKVWNGNETRCRIRFTFVRLSKMRIRPIISYRKHENNFTYRP